MPKIHIKKGWTLVDKKAGAFRNRIGEGMFGTWFDESKKKMLFCSDSTAHVVRAALTWEEPERRKK